MRRPGHPQCPALHVCPATSRAGRKEHERSVAVVTWCQGCQLPPRLPSGTVAMITWLGWCLPASPREGTVARPAQPVLREGRHRCIRASRGGRCCFSAWGTGSPWGHLSCLSRPLIIQSDPSKDLGALTSYLCGQCVRSYPTEWTGLTALVRFLEPLRVAPVSHG